MRSMFRVWTVAALVLIPSSVGFGWNHGGRLVLRYLTLPSIGGEIFVGHGFSAIAMSEELDPIYKAVVTALKGIKSTPRFSWTIQESYRTMFDLRCSPYHPVEISLATISIPDGDYSESEYREAINSAYTAIEAELFNGGSNIEIEKTEVPEGVSVPAGLVFALAPERGKKQHD